MYLVALVLTTVAFVEARNFSNPILADQDYYFPGAIKVNETYYLVSRIYENGNLSLTIHSSSELNNWKSEGNVFDESNSPSWGKNMDQPEIHTIGSNYVVYFTAISNSSIVIGAAVAPHPVGPYTPMEEPLLFFTSSYIVPQFPSIIKDQDKLYLVWTEGFINSVSKARQLTSDGLSFSSDQTTILLQPNTDMGEILESLWHIQRGSYHYLMYTTNCAVGVARSRQALGPYERLPRSIIASNNDYQCTAYPSLAKDLDGKSDIMFLTGYRRYEYEDIGVHILLASVSWDEEDWPYVEDF